MPTTQRGIRQRMLELEPLFGRTVAITSLTTTTAVVNQLATGTLPAGKYTDTHLLRPNQSAAANADRLRICSNFTASSGTFTHVGTNYADTTATDEFLEIWEHDPFLADLAIQAALNNLRYVDEYVLPTTSNSNVYSLHGDATNGINWSEAPSELLKVYYRPSPVLSNNRYFEKWNQLTSAGVQQPDHWVISGGGSSMALDESIDDTNVYGMRRRTVAVTRATNNVTLLQRVRLLDQGLIANLRGQTVTAVGVGRGLAASQLRIGWQDGVNTNLSSYHAGSGGFTELTVAATVDSAATRLDVLAQVNTTDGAPFLAELYLMVGSVNDAVRNDNYDKHELRLGRDYYLEGMNPVLVRTTRNYALGAQLVVETQRPWPRFDVTRVRSGSADADTSDVPEDDAAQMAIAEMWASLSARDSGNRVASTKALEWARRVAPIKAGYQYSDPEERLIPLGSGLGPSPWRPR